MKKPVYVGAGKNQGWRDHDNDKVGFPTKKEALDGFNDFIGWCVGQGMKPGDYSTIGLLIRLYKYILLLRK